MRISTIITIVAASVSVVKAKALLAVFPDEVTVGETYNVEWLADAVEKLELLLVHQTHHGWEAAQTIFHDRVGLLPGDNVDWMVDESYLKGTNSCCYALWLSSTPIPENGSGYADLTRWFKIIAAERGEEEGEAKEDLKV